MSETKRSTHLLVEGALIILSILIAFGIEAGWQSRAERLRGESVLIQMAEDFRGHRLSAERGAARHRARASSAAELLGLVGPSADPDREEALAGYASVATFNPVSFQPGMLETVLANEGISVVENAGLRDLLARWSFQVETLRDIQRFVIDESEALDAYLQAKQPLRASGRLAGVEIRGSEFSWDPRMIYRDLEFENLLVRQAVASSAIASRLERMRDIAAEIVMMAGSRAP